jgi:hypothetical protein
MKATVDAYKRDVDILFAAHCAQTSALIAMQHQYIATNDALHEQQMRDLTSSFNVRYQHLEAELTAEHVHNFRGRMSDAQAGLDLWADTDVFADVGGEDSGCPLHDTRLTMLPDPADGLPVLTPRSHLREITELLDLHDMHSQFEI